MAAVFTYDERQGMLVEASGVARTIEELIRRANGAAEKLKIVLPLSGNFLSMICARPDEGADGFDEKLAAKCCLGTVKPEDVSFSGPHGPAAASLPSDKKLPVLPKPRCCGHADVPDIIEGPGSSLWGGSRARCSSWAGRKATRTSRR